MEKESRLFFREKNRTRRLILASFCLSVIAAASLIGRFHSKNSQDNNSEDGFQPLSTRSLTASDYDAPLFLTDSWRVEKEEAIVIPDVTQTAIPAQGQELSNDDEAVSGFATYYGVDDGYGLGDTLGCTGESFDPYDPQIAARSLSSPFECGDKVEVCDSDSCIEVVIKDTCPGCDDFGIVIDLSKGAMEKLSPGAGKTWVTLKKQE